MSAGRAIMGVVVALVLVLATHARAAQCGNCTCDGDLLDCSDLGVVLPVPTTNATRIDLSRNGIAEIPDDSFPGAHRVTEVNITDNELSFLTGNAFQGLTSLHNLDLTRNYISDIHPETFNCCPSLSILNLSTNRVSNITFLSEIVNCSLTILDMTSNDITTIEENTFMRCDTLETLYLTRNKIEALDFSVVSSLRILHASHNNIAELLFNGSLLAIPEERNVSNDTGLDCEPSYADTGIAHLDLGHNHLDGVNILAFSSLSSLSYLNVEGNRIRSFGLACLVKRRNLSLVLDSGCEDLAPDVASHVTCLLPEIEQVAAGTTAAETSDAEVPEEETTSDAEVPATECDDVDNSSLRSVTAIVVGVVVASGGLVGAVLLVLYFRTKRQAARGVSVDDKPAPRSDPARFSGVVLRRAEVKADPGPETPFISKQEMQFIP